MTSNISPERPNARNIHNFTCTMTIIAETMGGPSTIARHIPLIRSLKNNHIVCCKTYEKIIRKSKISVILKFKKKSSKKSSKQRNKKEI